MKLLPVGVQLNSCDAAVLYTGIKQLIRLAEGPAGTDEEGINR